MTPMTSDPAPQEARHTAGLSADAAALYEALEYVLRTRAIKCLHKHPGPDEFCANCQAQAALSAARGEQP